MQNLTPRGAAHVKVQRTFPTFGRPIYGPWGVSESRGEKPHDGMRPPMDGMSHLGLLQSLHFGLPQSLHLRKKRGQLALPEYTHTQALLLEASHHFLQGP